jgi:transcriptional regulator with XRE-family HTH domain
LLARRTATVTLVRERQQDHISKRQLALVLNLSPTIVNRYAASQIDPFEVRFGVINRLSELLGATLNDLVSYFETGRLGSSLAHHNGGVKATVSGETGRPSTQAMLHFIETLVEQLHELGSWASVRKNLLQAMTADLGETEGRRQRVLWGRALDALVREGEMPYDKTFWPAFLTALRSATGKTQLGDWEKLLVQLGIRG